MAMGIRSIRFIAHAIPIQARIQLVHALVLSHMNYASVLYNDITLHNRAKLDTQLKWAIRVCFGIAPRTSCSKIQTDARILNADKLRQYFTLCKFSTLVSNNTKAFPNKSFPNFSVSINNRTQKFQSLKYKKNVYKNSFLRSAITHWNVLPQDITVKCANYRVFKSKLKQHLLDIQRRELDLTLSTRNTWRDFQINYGNVT